MNKFVKALVGAAMLLGISTPSFAAVMESTETDDVLDAVGEVTSTLTVANKGTMLSVYVNGTYVADAFLQREVGSPGSGAWENVIEVTGADDATVTTLHEVEKNNTAFRVSMTAFTSGDVLAQLTDGARAPQTFVEGASYLRHFDDFFTNTAALDAKFYVTAENDASGTVCVVTVTIQEGGVTCVSGTGEDALDLVGISLIDLTDDGALVSDGWTVFETSLQATDFDGQVGMCLHDEEVIAGQLTPFDVDSNVVTFNSANQANAVCIMNQDEATAATAWIMASANADTVGNNADEFEFGTVVDATYTDLRVELDNTGDAYFYVDGTLVYAENEVVATTARLIPFVWTNTSTDGSGGATTVIIDYIEFVMARPSS